MYVYSLAYLPALPLTIHSFIFVLLDCINPNHGMPVQFLHRFRMWRMKEAKCIRHTH